jgi:hypothetical protein
MVVAQDIVPGALPTPFLLILNASTIEIIIASPGYMQLYNLDLWQRHFLKEVQRLSLS